MTEAASRPSDIGPSDGKADDVRLGGLIAQTASRPVRDLVIVANRLPVHWNQDGIGRGSWERSPGGLVSALEPAIEMNRVSWIGWPGAGSSPTNGFRHENVDLRVITLTEAEVDGYYTGFSNSTLWPLYHDAVFAPQFDKAWWATYHDVNHRFANAAASVAPAGATVWIHDYHLQLVPQMIRDMRSDVRIGFFLHIPFPAQELFMRLPWRAELTRGMLGADVVGFQTDIGAQNFRQVAKRILGRQLGGKYVLHDDRATLVDTYPVGIDAAKFSRAAATQAAIGRARAIRDELGSPTTVLLGVDRLDYTKGIPARLCAYRELLEESRIDPTTTVMVQIAQPSRGDVPGYADVRVEVEKLVGGINGEFARLGHVAVKYLHQSQSFEELVALYLAADVMLVTPYRDGMNLVAKEYIASRLDRTGTLILSEFAGAAHQLNRAVLVNPFDIDAMKQAIEEGVNAAPGSTRRRMSALARVVHRADAQRWATSFLDALP